jgi:hypothetical protein
MEYRMRVMAAVFFAGFAASPVTADDWRAYANPRFGAAAEVPANWRPGFQPENGDGLQFTSPDGRASITVSGGWNQARSMVETVETYGVADVGEIVTYRHQDNRSFVVSGTKGDRISRSLRWRSHPIRVGDNVGLRAPRSVSFGRGER